MIEKMRPLAVAAGIALGSGLGAAAHAATAFSADLTAEQSTTPPSSADVGAAATLDLVQVAPGVWNLSMTVEFTDGLDFSAIASGGEIAVTGDQGTVPDDAFDVTLFHIHAAPRGVAGPVVFGLFGPSSDTDGDTLLTLNGDGTATLTSEWDFAEGTSDGVLADFVDAMLAAMLGEELALYFNLHTEDAPAGLIRGQIVAENNVIPVPGALPLFASVLAGIAIVGSRRRRRSVMTA